MPTASSTPRLSPTTSHPIATEPDDDARQLVFYDADATDDDPNRRQLAERAQAEGLVLRPRVEVEHLDVALRLVADGRLSPATRRLLADLEAHMSSVAGELA